jgi:glycosyltransferase involved in cell wall biosynthesis
VIGAPLRVRVVDRDRPVDDMDLSALNPADAATGVDDRRYRGVWVLVTSNGRPVGEMELEYPVDQRALAAALAGDIGAGLDGGDVGTGGPGAATASGEPAAEAVPPRLPFATVVLPTTFGRVELIRRTLATLTALDYPDYEVLVVDNRPGGDDSPVPDLGPAGDDPRLRLVRAHRPGVSAARNAGIGQARGEIVAFTDDDVLAGRGWLRALASRLAVEPDVDCATGLVLPAQLETDEQVWFERVGAGPVRRYRPGTYHVAARGRTGLRAWDRRRFEVHDRYRTEPGPAFSLYQLGPFGTGANMAFRTSAVKELGGFDESLGAGTPTGGGEDIAIFVRLLYTGRCLAFEPAAYVFHTHRRTYPELRRQINGYGRGLSAMLSAVVRDEPRHIFGLLRLVVPGLKVAAGSAPSRVGDAAVALEGLAVPIGDLRRARVAGLLAGPVAHLLSRHRMRRCGW